MNDIARKRGWRDCERERGEGEKELSSSFDPSPSPFPSFATSTRFRPLFLPGTNMNSYVRLFLLWAGQTKLTFLLFPTACPLSRSSSPVDVRGRSRPSSSLLFLLLFLGPLPFNLSSARSRNQLSFLSLFLQAASFARRNGGPFRSPCSAVASDLDLKGTIDRLGA